MAHQMTGLDAQHALYRETPWHRLGNVGHIDWEDARDAFDWCEVQRHPIHIEHDEIGVILDGRDVLKMVNYVLKVSSNIMHQNKDNLNHSLSDEKLL